MTGNVSAMTIPWKSKGKGKPLVTAPENYSQIDDDLFDKILVQTVVKKTWPMTGEIEGVVRDATLQGHGACSVADISTRMVGLVLSHV